MGIASNSEYRSKVNMKGDGRWEFSGSSASRLWEKSAIGRITSDNTLILSDTEIIFCHKHRNMDYPSDTWLSEAISRNPRVFQESAILESLRVPGNKIVLSENFQSMDLIHANDSWALRWESDKHPSKNPPVSELLIFHAQDDFDAEFLLQWCSEVEENSRIPEIMVIDNEQSVVTYRIGVSDFTGQMDTPSQSDFEHISSLQHYRNDSNGAFFPSYNRWPTEVIGIPLNDGRQVDSIEYEIILAIGKSNSIIDTSSFNQSTNEDLSLSLSANLLLELWRKGLNTRSGFKYGSSWRCYPGEVGDGHAPWLIVDPYSANIATAPPDWASACLSSRLASGVNKHWIYPIFYNGGWSFLEVSRPPSNSRWTNPTRN